MNALSACSGHAGAQSQCVIVVVVVSWCEFCQGEGEAVPELGRGDSHRQTQLLRPGAAAQGQVAAVLPRALVSSFVFV